MGIPFTRWIPLCAGASNKYGKPADYEVTAFPTFLNISPDGTSIWAGYSDLANEDARIYRVDVATGEWKLMAKNAFELGPGFLERPCAGFRPEQCRFHDSQRHLFTGYHGFECTSEDRGCGGSSAGIAIDAPGQSLFWDLFLYRSQCTVSHQRAALSAVIETPDAVALQLTDAEKLTDLPMGLYDCDVDAGGNVSSP